MAAEARAGIAVSTALCQQRPDAYALPTLLTGVAVVLAIANAFLLASPGARRDKPERPIFQIFVTITE